MKCDNCIHLRKYSGGSYHAVAEGMADPYPIMLCAKRHWFDGPPDYENEEDDPWKDCKDYKPIKGKNHGI